MIESAGKKLHDARVQRGISLEDAAHATKLRPDKITALEHDDYARFANKTYAKSFLQIYARYLGIDVSPWVQEIGGASPISVKEYQYLTNGVQRREPERATFSFSQKRPVPSIVPLVVFAALLVLVAMGYQFYINWERVTAVSPHSATGPAPAAEPVMPEAPAVAAEPSVGVPVVEVPASEPEPVAAAPVVNEVLVEPIKKTWIAVRRDDPKSAPVFEDFLYPDARPLKVKGASIFIEARDPSAIIITKNGAPIAYAPNVEIR